MRALSLYKASKEGVDDFFVAADMEGAIVLWRVRFGVSDDDEPDAILCVEDEVYVDDERAGEAGVEDGEVTVISRAQEWWRLNQKIELMEKAIRWALGEGADDDGDTFSFSRPAHEPDKPLPAYWWRTKLREMSGVDE